MFVAPLAIDLFVILACLGALIIIISAKQLSEALVHIVKGLAGKVPLIGNLFTKSAVWVEKHIVTPLADTANGLEGVIGSFWHALGNLIAAIGHEIYGLAVALNNFGAYMHGVVRPWVIRTVMHGLQHGIKWLRHEATVVKTQVYRVTKVIEHPVHTKIGGAVRTITRPFVAALHHIEAVELPGLRARTRGLEDRLARDIKGVRSLTREAERVFSRLWAHVRKLERVTVGAGAVALVATMIGRLGGGWIFCRNWKRIGRSVCRMPADVISLLIGGTIEAFIVADLCAFIGAVSTAAHDAQPLLLAFVQAEDVLIGCHGASKPPNLPLRRAPLPPLQTAAALPSL